MDQQAKAKLGKAKALLVIDQPFLAALVCSLPLVEDLSMPTLWTDGKQIGYHPAWINGHTEKEVMWALGHETLHCAFHHTSPDRRGARNPMKWNVAGDFVINYLLETDMPRCRPAGVLYNEGLYRKGGGTAEGVYAILPDPPEGGGQGQGGQGQGGQGMEPFDDLRDAPGDASEQADQEAMWSVKVSQAANAAKMQGKLSKEMERFVGELLNPKVPWADVLKRFCMRQTRTDRSFARPARRWLHQGMYMPGRSGVGMGDILIAVDQSGSISDTELQRFATEMTAIKEDACPAAIHVLYFADRVMKHDVFGPDEDLVVKPNGTGGTAFSPIFRYADEHDIHPDCCVVLTDLYCNDFGDHPDYPVLWVTTAAEKAPWGEVISMKD